MSRGFLLSKSKNISLNRHKIKKINKINKIRINISVMSSIISNKTSDKTIKSIEITSSKYLCNAFSINMLQTFPSEIKIKEISTTDASKLIASGKYKSAIGHASTAELLSNILSFPIKVNRTTLQLNENDELLLAQYYGERLPEGVIKLPEGSSIRWFLVVVK